jgi:holo-[acyl-carrier protein] synthase
LVEQSLERAVSLLTTGHVASLVSVGVDVVDMAAFAHNERVGGLRWLRKLFTEAELAAAGNRTDQLATGFAGKEAVAKALKTGFRGVSPRDIEVIRAPHGEPQIRLYGGAEEAARVAGIAAIPVSLSRDGGMAVAVALGLAAVLPFACEEKAV